MFSIESTWAREAARPLWPSLHHLGLLLPFLSLITSGEGRLATAQAVGPLRPKPLQPHAIETASTRETRNTFDSPLSSLCNFVGCRSCLCFPIMGAGHSLHQWTFMTIAGSFLSFIFAIAAIVNDRSWLKRGAGQSFLPLGWWPLKAISFILFSLTVTSPIVETDLPSYILHEELNS